MALRVGRLICLRLRPMRLTYKGACQVLMPPQIDVDSVRREVRSLLSDQRYATGAARLRDEIRAMPSPAEVVVMLESLPA
jgi:UDP:flavonoid glycosyltransferase YjiC (YdhE family)